MPDQEPTDKQQSEIDHKVDTRGIAYSDARQEVMGGKSSSPSPQDVGAPKRPRQHPKPGHVQDFDGRGDKDRGGPQLGEWLSPEQIETNRIGADGVLLTTDEADTVLIANATMAKLEAHPEDFHFV